MTIYSGPLNKGARNLYFNTTQQDKDWKTIARSSVEKNELPYFEFTSNLEKKLIILLLPPIDNDETANEYLQATTFPKYIAGYVQKNEKISLEILTVDGEILTIPNFFPYNVYADNESQEPIEGAIKFDSKTIKSSIIKYNDELFLGC